jgi:hypothetical protein
LEGWIPPTGEEGVVNYYEQLKIYHSVKNSFEFSLLLQRRGIFKPLSFSPLVAGIF